MEKCKLRTQTPHYIEEVTSSSSGDGIFTENKISNPQKYVAFAAMCVVVLTEALDATSIAVVLPVIAQSLEAGTAITFSLATSFLLASTVFQPVFSSLSSVFGRKPMLLVALTLFLTGAVVAALSKSIAVLLGGRILQGVGAAGTIALTAIMVTDLVSLRKRAPFYAGLNAMWAIGSVSGPIIGGAFANSNWRWIFWINAPLVVISSIGVIMFMPYTIPEGSLSHKLADIDYIGTFLFLVSATAFLVPVTLAGTIYRWSSVQMLVPFLFGICGLIAFASHQKYMAKNPIINPAVFSNRAAVIGHCGTFLHGILLWILLYYLPLYYEGVLGYSPLRSGLAALPETLSVAPAAIVTGILISTFGTYKWGVMLGWILTTVGLGLLCLLSKRTLIYEWVLINMIPGLGLGILVPSTGTAVQAATRKEYEVNAISMFYLLRAAGQTLGVAIGDAIFRAKLTDLTKLGSVVTVEGLLKLLRELHKDGGDDGKDIIIMTTKALRAVWITGCALAGVGLVMSFCMKEYSLDKQKGKTPNQEEG